MYNKDRVTQFKSRNKEQHRGQKNMGRRPRRKYQAPPLPQPCIVQDRWSNNLIYGMDEDWDKPILRIAAPDAPADVFPSRRQAKKAISHTIKWLEAQGLEWHKEDWQIVEL